MSKSTKLTGSVIRFLRKRGFGFIKPDEGGDEVFVHWEDLVTDDDWPFIEKGTEVEYLVEDDSTGKQRAKEVTLAGGEKIPVFTKPYEDREVNDEETFTGSVKFFDSRKGFGYIKPDQEITWEDDSSGEGLYFSRDGILTSNMGQGMILRVDKDLRVSFKVYKDKKGLGACEVQNEDETPLEYQQRKDGGSKKRKRQRGDKNGKSAKKQKTKEELIEEREIDEDETTYTGTVKFYKAEKEFGFITISDEITYNDVSVKEKIFVMKEDIVCYSDEVGMTEDSEVMFKIYKDSRGLGAYEVMNADGTPIVYGSESKKSPATKPAKRKRKITKKVAVKSKKKVVRRRKKKET